MAGFSELNLKIPEILAISIFMSILNLCSAELRMKKSFITSSPEHSPSLLRAVVVCRKKAIVLNESLTYRSVSNNQFLFVCLS